MLHSCAGDIETMWILRGLYEGFSSHEKAVTRVAEWLHQSDPTDALRVYSIAFQDVLRPTHSHVYMKYNIIEMYASAGMFDNCQYMLQEYVKGDSSPLPHASMWMLLLEQGKKARRPGFCTFVIEKMRDANIKSSKKMLKLLMDVYAENHMPEQAFDVVKEMRRNGMSVDAHTYATLMKTCIRTINDSEIVTKLVDEMKRERIKMPHRLWSSILMAYASARDLNHVLETADEMRAVHGINLNARDYTAIVRAYRESNRVEEGLAMLKTTLPTIQPPDVSLTTEAIRLYMAAGLVDEAMKLFESLQESNMSPDRGLYNIMLDEIMSAWCDVESSSQKDQFLQQACRIFDQAWGDGIFHSSRISGKSRTISQRGFTAHADLHRTGLWACQFAIIKHWQEMFGDYVERGDTLALKLISGKGKGYKQSLKGDKLSLIDVVREFLSHSKVLYYEDSVGVFSIPKNHLRQRFKKWRDTGFICDVKSFSKCLVDPRLYES